MGNKDSTNYLKPPCIIHPCIKKWPHQLKFVIKPRNFPLFFCKYEINPYLCTVFFIVLDLRLTKVGVQRYSFFYAHTPAFGRHPGRKSVQTLYKARLRCLHSGALPYMKRFYRPAIRHFHGGQTLPDPSRRSLTRPIYRMPP